MSNAAAVDVPGFEDQLDNIAWRALGRASRVLYTLRGHDGIESPVPEVRWQSPAVDCFHLYECSGRQHQVMELGGPDDEVSTRPATRKNG